MFFILFKIRGKENSMQEFELIRWGCFIAGVCVGFALGLCYYDSKMKAAIAGLNDTLGALNRSKDEDKDEV
jgi:hypothetical protein